MRTTLTLDDDVARRVERLAAREKLTWKEAVNRLLRLGLAKASPPPPARAPLHTEPADLAPPLVSLERTSELQVLEDESLWHHE